MCVVELYTTIISVCEAIICIYIKMSKYCQSFLF